MPSSPSPRNAPAAALLRLAIWVLMATVALSFERSAPSSISPAWRMVNVLAADALFLPALPNEPTAAGAEGRVTLVAAGAEWQYWDAATPPGPDWRDLNGGESWPAGPAPLGYGNGDEATVVSFGLNLDAKPTTVYFRHVFDVSAPADFKALDVDLLRDDGAVVYLNGQEVLRSNLPPGVIEPTTGAPATVTGDAEETRYHYTLDPTLLRAGANVLAAEVHQAAPNSSDLSFDLRLTATPHATVRFAVIGDYGDDGPAEAAVAERVKEWRPDFVVTVGDNNYERGAAATLPANVLKHYGEFITGDPGATRFFPALGNHDWYTDNAQAYFDAFALPGNERYYDFTRGDVHFFVLDSDPHEPDGVTAESVQAQWLAQALAASTAAHRIVVFHHPPYSSGKHGSATWMRWPFAAWGADAVLAGHEHLYERLTVDGLPYFINGLGGKDRHACPLSAPADLTALSQICFDGDYGAMLVEASRDTLTFSFITRTGAVIDTCTLPGTCE